MKLNNSVPPLAAGLLIATMAGCSDFELQNLNGSDEDEENSSPTNPIEGITPNEATPNTDDEPPPPDAPPSLPGSSLLESTCFGLLNEDSLAPLDEETDDYYTPVLDWMDRTRVKLGIALLQRLSHYDSEIDDLIEEYEESGEDLTIDLAIEKIRELLVKQGVTVWWGNYKPLEEEEWPSVHLMVGDRRADIERGFEEYGAGNTWLIPDLGCYGMGSSVYVSVNKMAPEDWTHPEFEHINAIVRNDVTDRVRVHEASSQPLHLFGFWAAEEMKYCPPPENDLGIYVHDVNGGYEFPWGTVCFENDNDDYEPGDFSSGTLLGQTTNQRLDELKDNTRLIVSLISGGAVDGQAYFEGSWFEE